MSTPDPTAPALAPADPEVFVLAEGPPGVEAPTGDPVLLSADLDLSGASLEEIPGASRVSVGGVALPPTTRRERREVGVTVGRLPAPKSEREVRPEVAGTASELFPRGGKAFARFCQRKGIDPNLKRPISEFDDMLREFADRPIHGHRRGPDGGNHKPNKHQLR